LGNFTLLFGSINRRGNIDYAKLRIINITRLSSPRARYFCHRPRWSSSILGGGFQYRQVTFRPPAVCQLTKRTLQYSFLRLWIVTCLHASNGKEW